MGVHAAGYKESTARTYLRLQQLGWYRQMKHRLDVELDFITDLSPVELASRVAPLVWEAVDRVRQSLGAELEFDIFLVLDGREVRFIMEPV